MAIPKGGDKRRTIQNFEFSPISPLPDKDSSRRRRMR
jgi:hypothetical protein